MPPDPPNLAHQSKIAGSGLARLWLSLAIAIAGYTVTMYTSHSNKRL